MTEEYDRNPSSSEDAPTESISAELRVTIRLRRGACCRLKRAGWRNVAVLDGASARDRWVYVPSSPISGIRRSHEKVMKIVRYNGGTHFTEEPPCILKNSVPVQNEPTD